VIRNERTLYTPGPGLRLEPGDTLMLLGDPGSIHKARELLHGHEM
jgi:K+/H+ antiporter YhaU regulatory subunit KhtT